MSPSQIAIIIAVLFLLALIILPQISKRQLKKMPFEQQVRILMKQADKLVYFKNISLGTNGTLVYIKNKRKMLSYPWVLIDGKMLCTRKNPFERWDYPEENPIMTEEEIIQAKQELEKYNKHNPIKLYIQNNDAE